MARKPNGKIVYDPIDDQFYHEDDEDFIDEDNVQSVEDFTDEVERGGPF